MKLALIVSGASGIELAEAFLRYLPKDIDTHLVLSEHAKTVAMHEGASISLHADDDIAAAIASGSFGVDATAVIPCSMNTLAKIAYGIADTLATRSAAVAIKEQKPLLLAPRELPFSAIALENMLKLSRLGVIIAPPVLGYYSDSQSVEEMERFLVGKWFDLLGIKNEIYRRWGG